MSLSSQLPLALLNPSTIPHPTTPSMPHDTSNPPQAALMHYLDYPYDGRTTPPQQNLSHRHPSVPTTPSKCHGPSSAIQTVLETPKRRKENTLQRLPGIKTILPANLSLASIRQRLVDTLRLTFIPDDWQVHLIRRVLQGYDSIFCAGTGYGKSLKIGRAHV